MCLRNLGALCLALGLPGLAVGGSAEVSQPIAEKTALVGGGGLFYLEAGPAGGLPVVLLHGARFHSGTWRELGTVERLAGSGFRVLALDLPGYGRSPASNVPREKFLAAVFEALRLGPPVLVAPSMSGAFALPHLVREPESLAGFVAVAPVASDRWAEELAGVSVPTLVLWGEEDRVFPPTLADGLAAAISGSSKVILPAAGHACYLDRPEEFHRVLLEFLQNLSF